MPTDPTYVRDIIDANPVWKLAWHLSEIDNDNAPIGWSKYLMMARCLLDLYDMKEKPK